MVGIFLVLLFFGALLVHLLLVTGITLFRDTLSYAPF